MSAYITLPTPMLDRDCLVTALVEAGFQRDQIEVHDELVPLIGYEGRDRVTRANVVIRKRFIGPASNDIGFEFTPTGFKAHVSDFDRSRFSADWVSKLGGCYQRLEREKEARLLAAVRAEEKRLAAIEAARLEEARRQLVEAQRAMIHDKAKQLGYRVEESRQGETIRLVLVKRVY
jgi:hypothetical protein